MRFLIVDFQCTERFRESYEGFKMHLIMAKLEKNSPLEISEITEDMKLYAEARNEIDKEKGVRVKENKRDKQKIIIFF